MSKKINWRQVLAINDEELLKREDESKTKALAVKWIDKLRKDSLTSIKVDENRVNLHLDNVPDIEFIDITFNKKGEGNIETHEDSIFFNIGPFLGQLLYDKIVGKRNWL